MKIHNNKCTILQYFNVREPQWKQMDKSYFNQTPTPPDFTQTMIENLNLYQEGRKHQDMDAWYWDE